MTQTVEMSKQDEERLMIRKGCILRQGLADGKPIEYWDIARTVEERLAARLNLEALDLQENNK